MRTLNLGILAHVDAGKTSLTERLLFDAGVIDRLGSVDTGNTQTDSLDLERQRGITIKAAVVSFRIAETIVNLIDTPGHPDFIAEVERTLGVLDAAVVVVSAVEGVQAQTRVLVRALQRLGLPFVFFINKVDRIGARYDHVTTSIAEQLQLRTLPMSEVSAAGSKAATVGARDFNTEPRALLEALVEGDEHLLETFVLAPERLTPARLRGALADQVRDGKLHPSFAGSAATGVGVAELMAAIDGLLPALEHDASGPVRGTIFKIDRGWGGEKQAYVALDSGTLEVRQTIELPRGEQRVTAIQVFANGNATSAAVLRGGQIGRLSGLASARIGDGVGVASTAHQHHHFAPPTLETRVLARRPSQRQALWAALGQLAEQDPLINLRHDEEASDIYVSLYGEVQKEVIQSTLQSDFGLEADFLESTVICAERLLATGSALEVAVEGGNPFFATVGLRVEPRRDGSGNAFALAVNTGLMPSGFYRAIEETVHEVLKQGAFGWPVIDCQVTLTAAGQVSPMSAAGDFRQLTPLVLAAALKEAGTIVCEPFSRFRIEAPANAIGRLLTMLGQAGAALTGTEASERTAIIEGTIAMAAVQDIQRQLPDITGGGGDMESTFDHYAPARDSSRMRSRSGPNPFRPLII